MYKILYTNQAKLDLEEIVNYISKESPKGLKTFLNDYEKKINLLKYNPKLGVECKNKNIKKDCRVLLINSCILVYKIFRIFHSRVNYP